MATLRSVLGKFNGTMADVTFSNWKGQNVAKQKVPDTNGSQSPAQIAQRTKFAALSAISGAGGVGLRVGFKMSAVDKTEQNIFMSRNTPNVSLDAAGLPVVLWPKLTFSEGQVGVVAPYGPAYDAQAGYIAFEYADNSNGADALPTDLVCIVAVNKKTLAGGAAITKYTRADGGAEIRMPFLKGAVLADFAVYVFMKRATTTAASNTAFLTV